MANGPIIDIGLKANVDEFIKELNQQLGSVKATGFSKAFEKDINDIEGMISDLQKQINNLGHSKVNTTTFSKSQQAIIDKVNELESRTSALETGMSTLIDTMSKADGGKFASQMKELSETMKSLSQATVTAISAISAFEDISNESAELHEMAQAVNEVIQAFDKTPNIKKFKSVEEAVGKVNEEYKKYLDTLDKMYALQDAGIGSNEDKKKLLSYQKELVATGDKVQEMIYKAAQTFGASFYENKDRFGVTFEDISSSIQADLNEIQTEVESKAAKMRDAIAKVVEEATKAETSKKSTKNVQVTVKPKLESNAAQNLQQQVDTVSKNVTATVSDVDISPASVENSADEISNTITDAVKSAQTENKSDLVRVGTQAVEAIEEGILKQEESLKNTWIKVFRGVNLNNISKLKSSDVQTFFTTSSDLADTYKSGKAYKTTIGSFVDTSKMFDLKGYGNTWDQLVYLGDGIAEESKEIIELYNNIISDFKKLEKIDSLNTEKLNGKITSFVNDVTGEVIEIETSTQHLYKSIQSNTVRNKLAEYASDLSGEAKDVVLKLVDDIDNYQAFLKNHNTQHGYHYGNNVSTDTYGKILSANTSWTGMHITDIYDEAPGPGKIRLMDETNVFKKYYDQIVNGIYVLHGAAESFEMVAEETSKAMSKTSSTKIGQLQKKILEAASALQGLHKSGDAEKVPALAEAVEKQVLELIQEKDALQERMDNMVSSIQTLNTSAKDAGYKKGFADLLSSIDDVSKLPDDIKAVMDKANLLSRGKSNLKQINEGFSNKGIFQNDEVTIIERGLKYADKIDKLAPKLTDAAKAGISVGEILGKIIDEETGIIYELQSTVAGNNIAKNDEYLQATDEQVKKLYDDIEKLNKLGLYIDFGGDNILYDKEQGFSFVDLAHHITDYNKGYVAENAKDTIDKYFKGLNEEFYKHIYNVVPQLTSEIADSIQPGKALEDTIEEMFNADTDANKYKQKLLDLYDDISAHFRQVSKDFNNGLIDKEQFFEAKGVFQDVANELEKLGFKWNSISGEWEEGLPLNNIEPVKKASEAISNLENEVENSVDSSSKKLKNESEEFLNISEVAEKASVSKEEFASANNAVLKSIVDSLQGLDSEGKAFENLNKLLNNLGGNKGSEKLEATKNGIADIISLLSQHVDESSFIKALQKISESGSNLSDIATILKASKKDLLEAQKVFNEINTDDLDDLMKNHAQEIIKNAKAELMALGGEGSQFINVSGLEKTKDGLIELVGLIKTADNELQEFTLHTKDGIHMQNVGMSENTAKIAKQMKIYAQVQQFFDKMKDAGTWSEEPFTFSNDTEVWKMLVDYAHEYYAELGNIKSITAQARKDGTLQSLSLNGEKGHLTVDEKGAVQAWNQQLLDVKALEDRIASLSYKTNDYYNLIKKMDTSGWNDADAEALRIIEEEYSDIVRLVKEYADILGDSTNITEVFSKALNKMTVGFNSKEQSYIDKASKVLTDALNNPTNKNQEFTTSFNAELTEALQKVEELQTVINQHASTNAPWSDEEIAKIKALHNDIDGTVLSIKDLENILAKSSSVDKLLTKIGKDISDNSAMPKELKQRYIELRTEIDNARDSLDGLNKLDFSKLEAEFNSLHEELIRTGQLGKSVSQQISDAIRSQSVQFIAKYFSLQDIIRYIQAISQNVVNLDSALTELRKVSDASTERLAQSFEKSAKTSQELGQSIQHVINVTADWARLGYNVDQAEELARVTALFTTVGDNMSADDASSYLISTLQGFQLAADQAENVVDKYNEVECCLLL